LLNLIVALQQWIISPSEGLHLAKRKLGDTDKVDKVDKLPGDKVDNKLVVVNTTVTKEPPTPGQDNDNSGINKDAWLYGAQRLTSSNNNGNGIGAVQPYYKLNEGDYLNNYSTQKHRENEKQIWKMGEHLSKEIAKQMEVQQRLKEQRENESKIYAQEAELSKKSSQTLALNKYNQDQVNYISKIDSEQREKVE